MKIKLFSVVILMMLVNSIMSQVAYIKNEELSENEIVLIGPSNVSNYFIGQAEIYIEEYNVFERQIDLQLENKQNQLEEYETKKIRSAARIGEMNQEIEKLIMQLEFLYEFIAEWENHKERYLSFQEKIKKSIEEDSCYQYEINNNFYNSNEIKISRLEANEILVFEEVLRDKYKTISLTIDGALTREKRQENRGRSGVPITDEVTFVKISMRNIQKTLRGENRYNADADLEVKDSEITEGGIELIERNFKTMILDKDEYVLYKTKNKKVEEITIQLTLKSTGDIVIPDSWEKTNCN